MLLPSGSNKRQHGSVIWAQAGRAQIGATVGQTSSPKCLHGCARMRHEAIVAAWRIVLSGIETHGKVAAPGIIGIAALTISYPGVGMFAAHFGRIQRSEDGVMELVLRVHDISCE